MSRFTNTPKIGQVFPTHSWGDILVLEYFNNTNILVQFADGNTKWTASKEVRSGIVKNDFQPHLCGVGYFGQGLFKSKSPEQKSGSTLEYETWRGVIRRCYDEKSFVDHPTYKDCSVCDDWHNYQNFAEWYTNQKGFEERWHLDKDLLVLGNKQYAPENCCLIPPEVNSLFTGASKAKRGAFPKGVHWCNTKKVFVAQIHRGGVAQDYLGYHKTSEDAFAAYKTAKEEYTKFIANKHRQNIPSQVYENLMNYVVDITD